MAERGLIAQTHSARVSVGGHTLEEQLGGVYKLQWGPGTSGMCIPREDPSCRFSKESKTPSWL